MPIEYRTGNIFDSGADVLVCPVNIVGVMGAGLAKQFAKRMPWIERDYKHWCAHFPVKAGDGVLIESGTKPDVLCLATKAHWKNPSHLDYIEEGLRTIRELLHSEQIESIAIPRLGCGLGGLDWNEVKKLMHLRLEPVSARVLIYEPKR